MNNYLLSIDPSLKNTGFTLWENKKPILIKSYNFKKYDVDNFDEEILYFIWEITKSIDISYYMIDIIIERGTFHSKNGIGYETQEHLRGFIAGQFNKFLKKDMLISPKEWQNWCFNILKNNNYLGLKWVSNKWEKEYSLGLVEWLIKENNWNIKVNNHDEADSLLIGWYYLNKGEK